MAFQQTMHNRRTNQQVRPGAQLFSPGCARYPGNRALQHDTQFHYSSFRENNVNNQRARSELHCQLHPKNPQTQQELSRQCQAQAERSGGLRRRNRLSFSRWHMMVSSRYKTEICRQFSEDGDCPFEDKCLFAHGQDEIRPLPRHPKYKTELCRDFHQVGFCSFGPRCNFIHSTMDITALTTAILRKNGRSSTPDSGNESCDDQSSCPSSASPLATPDQIKEDDETFFHFPESLYREITGGAADDEVSEAVLQDSELV